MRKVKSRITCLSPKLLATPLASITLVPELRAFRRLHLHRAHALQFLAASVAQAIAAGPAGPDCACAGRCGHGRSQSSSCGDFAVALVALDLFLLQHLVAPVLECGKALLQPLRPAAIQPHHGAGEIFQKAPVMADQHQRARAWL